MGAITEWRSFGLLAAAKIDAGRRGGSVFERRKFSLLMRAITKGLLVATSTTAPEIGFALFKQGGHWMFHGDDWFTHFRIFLSGLAREIQLSCPLSRMANHQLTARA